MFRECVKEKTMLKNCSSVDFISWLLGRKSRLSRLYPMHTCIFHLQIEEDDVVGVFEKVIPSALTALVTKCYGVTALSKLGRRGLILFHVWFWLQ